MLSSDNREPNEHSAPTSVEPTPDNPITTNGAPSDVVTEVGAEWVLSLAEHGSIPIRQLDAVVHATELDIRMMLESIDIVDGHIVDVLLTHLKARREGDRLGYLRTMKTLVQDPESPFRIIGKGLSDRNSLGVPGSTLPPPTVTHPRDQETSRSRAQALASQRANQLVAQYQLRTFDPAVDPHKFLEWKYDVLDVCNVEDCFTTKVEILLACLVPMTRLSLLQNLGSQSIELSSPRTMYESIISRLDSLYANFRAVRHIESSYLTLRIHENETIASFYTRFQRYARLYERSKGIVLNDPDKIIAFGSGLDKRYTFLGHLIETECCSFSDYAQRLIYLTSQVAEPSPIVQLNAVETRSAKRSRAEDNTVSDPRKRQFGCFRCQLGNHRAVDCINEVKDFNLRCGRCGSRKHVASKCIAKLSRNCRRCNGQHFESICPVAKTTATAAPIAADNFEQLQQAMLSTIHCDCDYMTSDIVDTDAPILHLSFAGIEHDALLDTGAAANFISSTKVIELHKSGEIKPEMVTKLDPPMRIRFGNGTMFDSNMSLKAVVSSHGQTLNATFVICPTLNPSLIAGRPLLRSMNLLPGPMKQGQELTMCAASIIGSDPPIAEPEKKGNAIIPWVETVHHGDRLRLIARFPLLENAMLEPIREPLRSRSPISERIILERLLRMCEEDSVIECALEQIQAVIPIVLIDKKAPLRRVWPDSEVHQRYRITFDLRGYNKLSLVVSKSGEFALISRSLSSLTAEDSKRKIVDQFQRSSFEIIRKMPMNLCVYFSKIDIANAYNSVFLMPSMQHVGTEVYDSESKQYRYFRCQTLSQGWKYSPTLFRMCTNLLVRKCKDEFKDPEIHIDFFQDDIIICSSKREELICATDVAIRILEQHSLRIRRHKVVIAAEEIVFCGYLLREGKCKPHPTRRQLNRELADKLWQELIQAHPHNREAVITWTRSFAGMCQYLYGFLSPEELRSLQKLYELSADFSPDLSDYRQAFNNLVRYITNGLPLMCLQSIPETSLLCTVLITDANVESWGGILLKILKPYNARSISYDGIYDQFLSIIGDEIGIDCTESVIMPVRIVGSKFGPALRKQSSTLRERVAILEGIDELSPLLEGEVIVITDNRNCQKEWHDIDSLGASLLKKWEKFCQQVAHTVWISREGIPKFADLVARIIALPDPNPSENSESAARVDESGSVELQVASTEQLPAAEGLEDNIRREILAAYLKDDTPIHGIQLSEIYKWKLAHKQGTHAVQDSQVDESIIKVAKFFEFDSDDLLWYMAGNRLRLYIPDMFTSRFPHGDKGLRRALLFHAHCPFDVHMGIQRTIFGLNGFWWPNISKDVTEFVNSCWTCVAKKTRLVRTHHDLSLSPTTIHFTKPFQAWFIDHCGPFDIPEGPKYALVCVCGFTHFCYAVAVDSVDANTTSRELFKLFCFYGVPALVHSDRGSAFTSELDAQLATLLKIDRRFSPIAFPRANGLCERAIGTIKKMIATIQCTSIGSAIPLACMVHNSMPYSRIDLPMTPFEVCFGFRNRSINDIYFQTPFCTQPFSTEIQYYIRKAYHFYAEELAQTTAITSALLVKASLTFQPGDLVIVVKGAKIGTATTVDGPYVLLNLIGSNIWRMFRLEGLAVYCVEYPVSMLKIYRPSPLIKDFPCQPPIPDQDPSKLKRHDFLIARDSEENPPTVGLFQALTIDQSAQTVTARCWRPNQLMEFFQTDTLVVIPWKFIILSRFKLSSRMVPDAIQKAAFSLLGGGL